MSNTGKTQSSPPNKNQILLKSTVWIQNTVTLFDQQQQPTNNNNISFKQQHRQYIIQKIKRRQFQNKRKIQLYGQSSSDQENHLKIKMKQVDKQIVESKQQPLEKQQLELYEPQKKHSKTFQDVDKEVDQYKQIKQKQKNVVANVNLNKVMVFLNEKKGSSEWVKGQLNFDEKSIRISHHQCIFYDINKLKIIFTDIGDKCFKLKVNWKNQEYIFAASYSNLHAELSHSFYIFSRIANQKIKIMGKKMSKFIAKPQGFPQTFVKNSYVHGKILKKSRIIGKWNEIFAVINRQGLFYSKKLNEKADILIARTSISELWTRFEFQGQFLVIKIFNNSNKIQLGIPIYNFMLPQGWIYHLYGLIFKNG